MSARGRRKGLGEATASPRSEEGGFLQKLSIQDSGELDGGVPTSLAPVSPPCSNVGTYSPGLMVTGTEVKGHWGRGNRKLFLS